MSSEYPEKCYTEVLARVSVLESKITEHNIAAVAGIVEIRGMITALTQGLGARVEKHGEHIAVLQEQASSSAKKIDGLENSRTWVIFTIVSGFIANIWYMINGRKP